MKILPLFCLCVTVVFAVEQVVDQQIGQVIEKVLEIPIENHVIHKDVFKAHQAERLSKLGGSKTARTWHKYGSRFMSPLYRKDYLSVKIYFGTPSQEFNVMLTGGTRTWVFEKSYVNGSQRGYDKSKSSTSKNMNKQFFQQDGSSNVTGQFYSDVMQFGKAKIRDQPFGVVTQISERGNEGFPTDGVLGLNHLIQKAYDSGELTAPIDNLLKSLSHKIVTIYMGKHLSPSEGPSTGQITIGGIDTKNCDGSSYYDDIRLYPSNFGSNRYVFKVVMAKYGDHEYRTKGEGYVDIGYSSIIVPPAVLQKLIVKISADYDWDTGLYTVPCGNIGQLSPFYVVNDDDYSFTINQEDYIIDLNLDDGNCAVMVEMDESIDPRNYILGTPAARSSCIVMDYVEDEYPKENSIGLYPHKNKGM